MLLHFLSKLFEMIWLLGLLYWGIAFIIMDMYRCHFDRNVVAQI